MYPILKLLGILKIGSPLESRIPVKSQLVTIKL